MQAFVNVILCAWHNYTKHLYFCCLIKCSTGEFSVKDLRRSLSTMVTVKTLVPTTAPAGWGLNRAMVNVSSVSIAPSSSSPIDTVIVPFDANFRWNKLVLTKSKRQTENKGKRMSVRIGKQVPVRRARTDRHHVSTEFM